MRDGRLPHICAQRGCGAISRSPRLTGQARLHAGEIEIRNVAWIRPKEKYELSGTASFRREIDFRMAPNSKWRRAGRDTRSTGTLEEPHVNPASSGETQARLKP